MQVCPALWHFITCGPVSTTAVQTHRGSLTSKSFPCSPFTVMLSGALATPGRPSPGLSPPHTLSSQERPVSGVRLGPFRELCLSFPFLFLLRSFQVSRLIHPLTC